MTFLEKRIYKGFDDNFDEFISDILVNLKKENLEYKKLEDKITKYMNNYPKISTVLEEREVITLNIDDVKILIELLNLKDDIKKIEQREIFISGIKTMSYLLKQTW